MTVGRSVSHLRAQAQTGDWAGNFPRSLEGMPVWSLTVVLLGQFPWEHRSMLGVLSPLAGQVRQNVLSFIYLFMLAAQHGLKES